VWQRSCDQVRDRIPAYLKQGCVLVVLLGLVLRFMSLGQGLYWYDETITSLRIAGYTEAEAVQTLSAAPVSTPANLQRYQVPAPGRGLSATLHSLRSEDPQHPPLYYLLAHVWMRIFGPSVSAIRSLSAVLSLLVLVGMAWLCWELFRTRLALWLGLAIVAISPIHLVYAQEARQYSLWSALILLASAALVRSWRQPAIKNWAVYTSLLALNWYTFLLTGGVVAAHGLFVLLGWRRGQRSATVAFSLAVLGSIALFAPWLIWISSNLGHGYSNVSWTALWRSPFSVAKTFFHNLTLPFIDFGVRGFTPQFLWPVYLLVLVLLGYSLWIAICQLESATRNFIFCLAGVPAGLLVLPDLVSGGLRSATPRYLIPTFLGIQLLVIAMLTLKWNSKTNGARRSPWVASLLFLSLVLSGVISGAVLRQAPVWWHQAANGGVLEVSRRVTSYPDPVLISDAELGDLLALSYYLPPDLPLQLRPQCWTCRINREFRQIPYLPTPLPQAKTVLLHNPKPSQAWLARLLGNPVYQLESLDDRRGSMLWRLSR